MIREIEPYIRTVQKMEQIAEFKKIISKSRKVLQPSIRNARKIFGLTESGS